MSLPLILAGPILRRVEPMMVAVWIALSEEREVQLSLWEGLVKDDGASSLFMASQPTLPALSNSGQTLRIGEQLHIAVAVLKLASAKALLPNRVYSYNVGLKKKADTSPDADLKSLKLLQNEPIDGRPHLALGYEPGFLPSFALPPFELDDLRILHGSCRRINHSFEDGLSWVDDFIAAARNQQPDFAVKRPHQLFLSGDQIYADDVSLPLLPQLIQRGNELLSKDKVVEFLPTKWPLENKATFWPADAEHFPPGMRQHIVNSEARFTTVDTHSHLISFGEFAAMYLYVWSNVLWDVSELKNFDDTINRIGALPPTWGALFKERDENNEGVVDDPLLQKFLQFFFVTLNKSELRTALTMFDTDNLSEEKMRVYDEKAWVRLLKLYTFATGLNETVAGKVGKFKHFFDGLKSALGGLYQKNQGDGRKEQAEKFFNTLTKVRRAMANVPTYMMFDDHEVTDDWNLNPLWRDRVFTAPMGRTIIRNALVAYALFQDWGNDPDSFATGKKAELLQLVGELFPAGNAARPEQETLTANKINMLLGLDGKDPPVKWHFSVPGAKHRVLALDNRTRRAFVSRLGPPGNLSPAAIAEQIPAGPLDAGLEVLLVIAPLPVLGPPVLDELVAPLVYRVFDVFAYKKIKGMPGTHPDAIEAWAFDPKAFEALLKRLQPYRCVVFLSGDVHYASSQAMSYWLKDKQDSARYLEPTRFVQFTSSGLRNVMPPYIGLVDRSLPLAQRIIRADIGTERLGWNDDTPPPLTLPADGRVVPALKAKLTQTPVMIPTEGWPQGTTLNTAHLPDWRWRVEPMFDERPDRERPLPAQPEPLTAELNAAELTTTLNGYRDIARRQVRHLQRMQHGRQILFVNNLGLVRFEYRPAKENPDQKKILHAIHELYAVHPNAQDPSRPELYTFHVGALELEKPFEALPTVGGGS